MAEIQQPIQPAPVSVGLGAQALVSPVQPVVTPDAVQVMSDAFRRGAISVQDITDRIDQAAQLGKKVRVEEAKELLDPVAIAARKAAQSAALSQSQLVQQQAEAGKTLLPAQTQAAWWNASPQWMQPSLKTLSDYGIPPVFKLDEQGHPTSEVDIERSFYKGSNLLRAQFRLQTAQAMLNGEQQKSVTPDGKEIIWFANKLGQNVTPTPDEKGRETNPVRKQWERELMDAYSELHAPADEPHQPLVVPKDGSETPSTVHGADLSGHLPNDMGETAPVINPAPGTVATGFGPAILAKTAPGTTPKELRDRLESNDVYKEWLQKMSISNEFKSTVNEIFKIPQADRMGGQVNMNLLDSRLSSGVRQLLTASATGGTSGRGTPELQLASMEEHSPWLQSFKNWKQLVMRTGRLNDAERTELAEIGRRAIAARELGARDVLSSISEQAKRVGGMPLYDYEHQLLNSGADFSRPESWTAAPGAPTTIKSSDALEGQDVTYNGKTYRKLPNGKFMLVR